MSGIALERYREVAGVRQRRGALWTGRVCRRLRRQHRHAASGRFVGDRLSALRRRAGRYVDGHTRLPRHDRPECAAAHRRMVAESARTNGADPCRRLYRLSRARRGDRGRVAARSACWSPAGPGRVPQLRLPPDRPLRRPMPRVRATAHPFERSCLKLAFIRPRLYSGAQRCDHRRRVRPGPMSPILRMPITFL